MKKTNINRVLAFLEVNGSITPEQAWEYCSCYRLSAVIFILRQRGVHIRTDRMEGKNKFGQDCHYAKYVLEEAA